MSVDVTARLGYGWMVDSGDIPESYHEDGIGHLDGIAKRLGCVFAEDLVCRVDSYADHSPYFVGIMLSDVKQVADDSPIGYGFRQKTPSEFADECLGLLMRTANMKRFYNEFLGKAPKEEPAMFLFENWW